MTDRMTLHDPIQLWTDEDLELFLSGMDELFAMINVGWMGIA